MKGVYVAQDSGRQQGIYRFKWTKGFLGSGKLVLPDAVPPCSSQPLAASSYGWVTGGLPAPHRDDRYLVEFLTDTEYRLVAYVDRFGRAFSTNEPLSSPPAREPDVMLAKYPEQPEAGVEIGCVQVRDADGTSREVAQYRCIKNSYTLFDSWYDFGPYGEGLPYDQALARCYFAFVYRPALCGTAVPDRGLDFVFRRLRDDAPLAALRAIVRQVRCAESDAVMRPPALARCLAGWLEEAGLDEVLVAAGYPAGGVSAADLEGAVVLPSEPENPKSDPLRLVRTARYANTFYIGIEDEDARVSERAVWALEAALNRFLLIAEKFGESAAVASDADCGRWDAYLIESVAQQALDASHPEDASGGDAAPSSAASSFVQDGDPSPAKTAPFARAGDPSAAAGEWAVRVCVGRAMENLRLPMRFAAEFRADVAEGVVAFDMVAPDEGLMPRWRWDDATARWEATGEGERAQQALRYAEHLGLALAAAAFNGSQAIGRVMVTARPFVSDGALATPSCDGIPGLRGQPFYQVTFPREAFCAGDAYRQAASADPRWLFEACGAVYAAHAKAVAPFAVIEQGPAAWLRRDLPETSTEPLTPSAQDALGARTTHDLRISYDAQLRRAGERVAEAVVRTQSATEAIKAVRATQDETDDPLVFEACTRLMAALAEGTVDTTDENALVACFLGEDPYAAALMRARAVAKHDPAEAASLLAEVIAEAEASLRYSDNAEAVHRMFDSYVSRVVYNRQRPDAGKHVELVPATLVFCYLESVKLLEESFAHADEALRCGVRCMEMAPTFSAAFRQTARAYMLVGDLESAASALVACLRIALQPEEIAIAYYQLAYVEWKAGRLDTGVACYLKSIMTSPVYGAQSTVELQELLHEPGARMVPRDEVDEVLDAAGIPVAPREELLDQMEEALRAAVDANVFSVARSLLSLRLHYRPDDALVNVLRSLEVAPV